MQGARVATHVKEKGTVNHGITSRYNDDRWLVEFMFNGLVPREARRHQPEERQQHVAWDALRIW